MTLTTKQWYPIAEHCRCRRMISPNANIETETGSYIDAEAASFRWASYDNERQIEPGANSSTILLSSLVKFSLVAQDVWLCVAKHRALVDSKKALQHQNQMQKNRTYLLSNKVLVWRETLVENRIWEWTGRCLGCSYDTSGRSIIVKNELESPDKRCNVAEVYYSFSLLPRQSHFIWCIASSINQFATPPQSFLSHMTETIDRWGLIRNAKRNLQWNSRYPTSRNVHCGSKIWITWRRECFGRYFGSGNKL